MGEADYEGPWSEADEDEEGFKAGRPVRPRRKLPDYQLQVKERGGQGRTVVGAGWVNEAGHITIVLNPCVVLSKRDNVFLTLFPVDRRE